MKTSPILRVAVANAMLATLVQADLPKVTITTAPEAVQTALVSFYSDYDHHTLGVNATVGAVISSVYMASAANPTAADAILNVRSHINFMAGPTPLFKDLENPDAVVSSIAAQLPSQEPFQAGLAVVSSLYGYLASVASSEINGETTIPPAPSGWSLPPISESSAPQTMSTSVTSTAAAVTASECPARARSVASSTLTSAASAAATSTAQEQNGSAGLMIPRAIWLAASSITVAVWWLA